VLAPSANVKRIKHYAGAENLLIASPELRAAPFAFDPKNNRKMSKLSIMAPGNVVFMRGYL